MVEAFRAWCEQGTRDWWAGRLGSVAVEDIEGLIARVPESEMSGPARTFAQAILKANRGRILKAL